LQTRKLLADTKFANLETAKTALESLTRKCGFRINQQTKTKTLVWLLCECNGTPPVKVSAIKPDVKPRKVRDYNSQLRTNCAACLLSNAKCCCELWLE
jgi:hypothetical protein